MEQLNKRIVLVGLIARGEHEFPTMLAFVSDDERYLWQTDPRAVRAVRDAVLEELSYDDVVPHNLASEAGLDEDATRALARVLDPFVAPSDDDLLARMDDAIELWESEFEFRVWTYEATRAYKVTQTQ